MLLLSTPAGIEEMVRGLAEPARRPWLQPPPDGPRVPADRVAAVERETGTVRRGPPPLVGAQAWVGSANSEPLLDRIDHLVDGAHVLVLHVGRRLFHAARLL